MLKVGDPAPEFSSPSTQGNPIGLKDVKGKEVVLYFYPKDFTPGCTQEACDFRDQFGALQKKGAVVLGVSPDTVEKHKKFIEEHKLPFDLLADPDNKVSRAYGVYQKKSMYGKTYMGVQRATFCIDKDGLIKAIYPKVKVEGHVQEVLGQLE